MDHIKPDEDQPWRFACPDCGSVSIEKLQSVGKRPRGKTYGYTKSQKDQLKEDRMKRYRCRNCQERKKNIVDKKTGNIIRGSLPT